MLKISFIPEDYYLKITLMPLIFVFVLSTLEVSAEIGPWMCGDIPCDQVEAEKDQRKAMVEFEKSGSAWIIILVLVIIIIIAVIAKSRGNKSGSRLEQVQIPRKEFSWQTKEQVKTRQHGKCAKCGKYPTHWEFHHISGRDDNDISNCEGLCHDCHDDKTF